MEISKIGITVPKKVANLKQYNIYKTGFQTNPINNNKFLKPLTKDVVQIKTETEKFIDKLENSFSTSEIKVNGQKFTKFNGSQMGSNPAYWAKDNKTNELFYIKIASTPDKMAHLEEEATACKLYNLAGIAAPEMDTCKINDGTVGIKSKFTNGLREMDWCKEDKELVQDAFAADAWLANWDALPSANTKIKNGKAYKIDNGGALRFRAQGKLKPNFGDKVEELTNLIDGMNWASTSTYKSMSHEALINSFRKVCNISDKDIKSIVKDKSLAKTLINRKSYMSEVLQRIENTPFKEKNLYDYMVKVV